MPIVPHKSTHFALQKLLNPLPTLESPSTGHPMTRYDCRACCVLGFIPRKESVCFCSHMTFGYFWFFSDKTPFIKTNNTAPKEKSKNKQTKHQSPGQKNGDFFVLFCGKTTTNHTPKTKHQSFNQQNITPILQNQSLKKTSKPNSKSRTYAKKQICQLPPHPGLRVALSRQTRQEATLPALLKAWEQKKWGKSTKCSSYLVSFPSKKCLFFWFLSFLVGKPTNKVSSLSTEVSL